MSARHPRFEVVRSDAKQPWFARYVAANGKEVWRTSENYTRKRGAMDAALNMIGEIARIANGGGQVGLDTNADGSPFVTIDGYTAFWAVSTIDERTP